MSADLCLREAVSLKIVDYLCKRALNREWSQA